MLLTVMILGLLWLMQTVFFGSYYKAMKRRQILAATRQVSDVLDSPTRLETIYTIATDNDLTIVLSRPDGRMLIEAENMVRGNVLKSAALESRVSYYLQRARAGTLTEHTETLPHPYMASESLFVVRAVSMGGAPAVLFIYGSIEPTWATADILSSQLLYITGVLLVLAGLIALVLSRRISQPIVRLTASAQQLATGDYASTFEGGTFAEIDELADTLNGAAVELGRVEALRRELVANVSHDLRTPLTMIKAYAEMIRDLTGDNAQKREEQLGIIISEADRLGRLVSDLVAISREEILGADLERRAYDLAEALRQLAERFSMSYPDYRFEVEAQGPCMVWADPDRIDQALYNLVTNAVTYTGEDGLVEIKLRRMVGAARVEVLDSGPGVPKEEMPLIWQRYYRSSFHKTAKAGTGLGLSIVREIMSAHGAGFGVTARKQGGSCFWIELPLAGKQRRRS